MTYDNLGTGNLSKVVFFKENQRPSGDYTAWKEDENNFKQGARSLGFIDAGYSSADVFNAHYNSDIPYFIYDGAQGYIGFKTISYAIIKFKTTDHVYTYKADGNGIIYLKDSGVFGNDTTSLEYTGTQHWIPLTEVNIGQEMKYTYRSSGASFLDYIEMTDTSAGKDVETSGSPLYKNSFLTRIGSHFINNKQFKIISYPNNPPVGGENEGYHFSKKQNYTTAPGLDAPEESKKYKDGTVSNVSTDILIESFSAHSNYLTEPTIIDVQSDNFTYRLDGINYTTKKNSGQDVYIIKRTSNNSGVGNGQPNDAPVFYDYRTVTTQGYNLVSAYGFMDAYNDRMVFTPFARCVPNQIQANPWCYIQNCTTEVQYKCNTEANGHNINTNQTINSLFEDTNFSVDFYCPAGGGGGYLGNGYGFAVEKNNISGTLDTNSSYYLRIQNSSGTINKFAVEFDTSDSYTYHVRISGQYKRFKTIGETLVNDAAFDPNITCCSGNVYYNSITGTWLPEGAATITAYFDITCGNRGIFSWNTIFSNYVDIDFLPDKTGITNTAMLGFLSGSAQGRYTQVEGVKKDKPNFETGIVMQVRTKNSLRTAYAIILVDNRN